MRRSEQNTVATDTCWSWLERCCPCFSLSGELVGLYGQAREKPGLPHRQSPQDASYGAVGQGELLLDAQEGGRAADSVGALEVQVYSVGGQCVLKWQGIASDLLGLLRTSAAEAAGTAVGLVQLSHGGQLLTNDDVPIGSLLPQSCIVNLFVTRRPWMCECKSCGWQLGGFTCARCEELLVSDGTDRGLCQHCQARMPVPTCCKMPMLSSFVHHVRDVECARVRDPVHRILCPRWECQACGFGVMGISCLVCSESQKELERQGAFERMFCEYVWCCPQGCGLEQNNSGGQLHKQTLECVCGAGHLHCAEYYKAFGQPYN